MNKSIRNLKIKSIVYDICSKGCVLTGTGFLGGAIALSIAGLPNADCTLISFVLLSTGIPLTFDADNMKHKLVIDENNHKKSILAQRKYYSHVDSEIPTVKPLLTETELQGTQLDVSAIETKPLVKHH